ncbi:MAG TPA: hypothetical protein VM470_09455 [Acidimicrobiia bacterium]|nr:hypothetical protein [Acidimicrobiia bacterium]
MTRLARVLVTAVAVVLALVILYFLFEWGGDFLDTGGVVGG